MTRRDLKPSSFKREQYEQMLKLYEEINGQVGYEDLAKLWNVKHVQAVLYAFKHFGWQIPLLADKRKFNGRKPKASKAKSQKKTNGTCGPLDHSGCKMLAIDLVLESIREIKRGKDIENNMAFLRSRLGVMALDIAGIEPQKAINIVLSRNGLLDYARFSD